MSDATVEKPKLREKYERGIYRRQTRDGATRWDVLYVDRAGKQRWETCGSLKAAQHRRHELYAKPKDERAAPDRSLFAEYAETWYASRTTSKKKLRPRTSAYYRRALDLVLLPRFGRVRLAAIDADAITKLIADLEREGLHAVDPERPVRPLGSSSIENYLKPLQGTLALAARRGRIPANPFALLTSDDRPAKEERARAHEWTAEETAALLDAARRLAEKPETRYDYAPLLRVTATLGLRLGETLGLVWRDFEKDADDGAGVVHVRQQWLRTGEYGPPKTKAGVRRIELPAVLRDELIALRLRSASSRDDQPVFASRQGTPLGHRNVTRRGFEPARVLAKLPEEITFHDLRHAAASRLIHAGLDPVAVARVLGHEDATVTLKVYGHIYDRKRTGAAVRAALAGEG